MNVILFQNRFEEAIVAGVKDCTIRAPRKDGRRRVRDQETVSLRVWTGKPYKSKQREFAQRVVKFVFSVRVHSKGFRRTDIPGGCELHATKLSKWLGFSGWREAKAWYEQQHGLPFEGVLVHFPKIV